MADSHHSLSLTQTSERSPHIFVDASGSPLSVYLDVNPEIVSRPRLTRLLRVGIAFSHPNSYERVHLSDDCDTTSFRHQAPI